MVNQFIALSQEIIKAHDPSINTQAGGPLYFVMILPGSKIYEDIQSNIDIINNNVAISTAITNEDKILLLENFGIEQKQGTPATGKIKIVVSTELSVYSFPSGTIFLHELDEAFLLVNDLIIDTTESVEAIVDIQTDGPSDIFLEIGEILSSSLYSNLIISSTVSTQVSNGNLEETADELLVRIRSVLARNTISIDGIKFVLKEIFSNIIDIVVATGIDASSRKDLNRKSGVPIDVYIKLPLTAIQETLHSTSGIFVIEKIIVELQENSENIISIDKINAGTSFEKNILFTDRTITELTVIYTTPEGLEEIQNYVDSATNFPMGVDILVKQPNPVLVTGTILFKDPSIDLAEVTRNLQNYISVHAIKEFFMSDLITAINLQSFELPIIFNFANLYTDSNINIENKYSEPYSAYYYSSIQLSN